jgi:hypothetical protein
MIYKLIGTLVIAAAIGISYLTFKDENGKLFADNSNCRQLTPAQQLTKLIADDFEQLEKNGQLPKQWKEIATIEYNMHSTLASALLGSERPRLQRIKDGKYFLEVEVIDMPDEVNPGIILQTSLFDIKSKNKIYEIGRTYTMNQLNRVKSSEDLEPKPESKATKTKKIETH